MSEIEKVYLNDVEGQVMVVYPGLVFGHGLNRAPLNKVPKAQPTVIDLSEPERCYHQTYGEVVKGTNKHQLVRCSNLAAQDGKHGWLCDAHRCEVHGNLTQLRFDAERQHIADILAIERAALKNGKRERVQVTPTESILYLVP